MQSTGRSALHFSVERGNAAATKELLKAGANAHLEDKVYSSNPYQFLLWDTFSLTHTHTLLALIKNGLTALEIAQVKVTKRVAPGWGSDPKQLHYEGVISLLKDHIGERSTTLPSHHVSLRNEICQR